jgi:branched-chain amino acid transport system substrate-binding protein
VIEVFKVMRGAITALAVVIALFLSACQPKMLVRIGPEEVAVPEIYNSAKQNIEEGRYEEAISSLKRILEEYPDNPKAPAVKYELARVFHRTGDFEDAVSESLEWLEMYPGDPLKGEVLILLGKSYRAIGDRAEAFHWWVVAAGTLPVSGYEDVDRGRNIDALITDLIDSSPAAELEAMLAYDSRGGYRPIIYHRLVELSLEENRFDDAKEFTLLLVRSSQEKRWLTIGGELLDKICESLGKEPGDITDSIAMGCLLPLSGPFAIYGDEVLKGVELGMGLFNKSEIEPNIELVIRDTKGNQEDAVAGVEDLADKERVMAIIGPLASAESTAAVKRAQELGVPIVSLTQKQGITREGDMVFRNYLTPSKEVEAVLNKCIKDMGMENFGIFYPDNTYGRFFMNLFWDRVEEMGGSITAVESYKAGETDFADGIKKMVGLYYPRPESVSRRLETMKILEALEEKEYSHYWEDEPWYMIVPKEEIKNLFEEEEEIMESPVRIAVPEDEAEKEEEGPEPIVDFDAVFVPDSSEQVALITPQFPFYNVFNVTFLGTSLWLSDELLDSAGGYVQGAMFPVGFFPGNESEIVRGFVESYKESFESEPGALAANGYDIMSFIKDILSENLISNRIDLQEALLEHGPVKGVTGEISFDEQGEVEKDPVLLTVYGRRFHLLRSSPQ